MTSINNLGALSLTPPKITDTNPVSISKQGFGDILKSTVEQVNASQLSGDKAIENLQTGEAKHLHEVMIAVEEADVSLRLLVQMRNKALTAYEEIMRMQV